MASDSRGHGLRSLVRSMPLNQVDTPHPYAHANDGR